MSRIRKRRRTHFDPMREIDLLLLEDIMMRRDVPIDARARALQTLCMLVVLAAVGGLFIHTFTHKEAISVVSSPTGAPNWTTMVP